MRLFISILLMACVTLSCSSDGWAKSKRKASTKSSQTAVQNNSLVDAQKYAAIVIDSQTGTVLFDKGSDKVLHPASLTKVMTLMLLFDAMENGNVRLGDKITISDNAASQAPSKLGLQPGSSIRVEDAILAVVTKSANDIAVAIGEHLAGSEDRFAERMTRRAHEMGMNHTNFVNASGLHDPRQVSSARDMALLARFIINRYPNYYRYFGTKQFTYRGKTYTNHNRLMQTYPGMDGFKTGFISQSGFNLIASAKHDGQRLIGVVFGGKSWKSRNDHMAVLLNNAFAKMNDIRYAQAAGIAPPVDVPPATIAALTPPPVPVAKPALIPTTAGNVSTATTGQGNQTALTAPEPDIAEEAMANVQTAINRGDYSELTGEGDYDIATTKRVETGLLAAAVYKGEHEKVRRLQKQPAPAPQGAPQNVLTVPQPTQAAYTPQTPAASQLNQDSGQTLAASDLWSVQIGAYTSRVATDDALRLAVKRLPPSLAPSASPIVVPLKTSDGIIFRARLGGFTQTQTTEVCQYFHDCLPVAPR